MPGVAHDLCTNVFRFVPLCLFPYEIFRGECERNSKSGRVCVLFPSEISRTDDCYSIEHLDVYTILSSTEENLSYWDSSNGGNRQTRDREMCTGPDAQNAI